MCKNKIEWMLLDIANTFYGFTMVPIAETLDVVSLEAILHLTGVSTLFVSSVALKNILSIKEKHNLKTLVLLEPISEEQTQKIKEKHYTLLTY